MDRKTQEAFTREAAKGLKTEKGLNKFSQMLTKITMEAAINTELDDHLGYERHHAPDIRRAIYSPNANESINNVIRKAINKHKLFPTDGLAKKGLYLDIMDVSKKWTMPIRNWKPALNRFIIEFEDRISDNV